MAIGANLAVLAGIVFLAVEIRQNTISQEVGAYQSLIGQINTFAELVIAKGNYVVLHCHQEWPDDLEYAGIDIFRFDDDGRVVCTD